MYGRFTNEYIFRSFDTIAERKEFYNKILNNTDYCYVKNVQYSKLSKDLKTVCDNQLLY